MAECVCVWKLQSAKVIALNGKSSACELRESM